MLTSSSRTGKVVRLVLVTLSFASLVWRQYRQLIIVHTLALASGERSDLPKHVRELEARDRPFAARSMIAHTSGRELGSKSFAIAHEAHGITDEFEGESIANVRRLENVELRYNALFKELGLRPEQATRLKSLLDERERIRREILDVAEGQGVDPRIYAAGLRKLIADAQGEIERAIEGLVGKADFDTFRSYERTLPLRSIALSLQERLIHSDTPLSDQQAEELVGILAVNVPVGTDDSKDNSILLGDFALGQEAASIPTSAVSQSWAVLSQPQVADLEQLQRQQQMEQQPRKINADSKTGERALDSSGNDSSGQR